MRHKAVLVLGFALLALVVACGDTAEPLPDIEATVEARVELAKASVVARTAVPLATYTPAPTPSPMAIETSYDELFRNNENYVGQLVRLQGSIVQVQEYDTGDAYLLRVNVTLGEWDFWEKVTSLSLGQFFPIMPSTVDLKNFVTRVLPFYANTWLER